MSILVNGGVRCFGSLMLVVLLAAGLYTVELDNLSNFSSGALLL